jgi:chemotaxis protein MotB
MVFVVILAAGCGVSKDEFAAQQRDAQANLKKYQDEAAKTAALETKVNDLKQQLDTAEKQLAESKATSAQLEKEKGVLEEKSANYQKLASSLEKQIASGQIEISELRGKMTVKLKDQIMFASASSSLNKGGLAALDAVADAFKGITDKNVMVAGYTDNVPTSSKSKFKDNWDLSAARATTVVRYLQSKGVAPARLGAIAFAEYRPLAPNDSAANRSQNRRIEIVLTPADYAPRVVELQK